MSDRNVVTADRALSEHVAPPKSGPLRVVWSKLSQEWILFVLVGLVVLFSVLSPNFATAFNLKNIANDVALLLIMGIGQTYVMISGGIDLSIGSVLVFSGIMSGKVLGLTTGAMTTGSDSWSVWVLAILVGLLSGLAWGVLNGVLIGFARIPPLIVTLGTLGMAFGLAQIMTNGVDLSGVPGGLSGALGQGNILGLPTLVLVAAATALVGGLFLAYSRFGRYTYAIGSNPEAARRVAIPVRAHIVKVYALQGLLAGLAGVLALTRFTTTTITSHGQDNLAVIAGVVLGGTSLFGGYGSILKTVVGIMIPAVLANGLIILGIQAFWQTFVTGALLVLAVFIDQLKRRTRMRGS